MRSSICSVLLFSAGCSAAIAPGPDPVKAYEFIDLCITEVQRRGGVMDEKIDRVYVLTADKRFELMFTKGEFGTFGVRSENFEIGLHCHLIDGDSIRIDYLGEPPSKTYILIDGGEHIMTTPSLKSESVDMLYLKRGNKFEFSDMQKYNRDSVYEVLRTKAEKSEAADGTVLQR